MAAVGTSGEGNDTQTLKADQLEGYLVRIRYQGPRPLVPSLAVLTALHRAHAYSVPYEVLDWHIAVEHGGAYVPEKDELQLPRATIAAHYDRIVVRHRGGDCIAQNSLFAAALRAIGFEGVENCSAISLLEHAMAKWVEGDPLPGEGHMVVLATCERQRYLCDLASPQENISLPLRWELDALQESPDGLVFQLRTMPENSRYFELRQRRGGEGAWRRVMAINPQKTTARRVLQGSGDNDLLRRHLIILQQRPQDALDRLVDSSLYRRRGTTSETTTIWTADEYQRVLKEVFQLDMPSYHLVPLERILSGARSKL